MSECLDITLVSRVKVGASLLVISDSLSYLLCKDLKFLVFMGVLKAIEFLKDGLFIVLSCS